jgi:hypothetical protein
MGLSLDILSYPQTVAVRHYTRTFSYALSTRAGLPRHLRISSDKRLHQDCLLLGKGSIPEALLVVDTVGTPIHFRGE